MSVVQVVFSQATRLPAMRRTDNTEISIHGRQIYGRIKLITRRERTNKAKCGVLETKTRIGGT
jgi:hypothetical protein